MPTVVSRHADRATESLRAGAGAFTDGLSLSPTRPLSLYAIALCTTVGATAPCGSLQYGHGKHGAGCLRAVIQTPSGICLEQLVDQMQRQSGHTVKIRTRNCPPQGTVSLTDEIDLLKSNTILYIMLRCNCLRIKKHIYLYRTTEGYKLKRIFRAPDLSHCSSRMSRCQESGGEVRCGSSTNTTYTFSVWIHSLH